MILRHFPPILRPLVAPFVPSFWKLQSSLRKAKKALIPTIEKRRKAQDAGDSQKQDNFLQWMMDAATPDEGGVEKMAHRQLNVILGSGHTSTMAGTHVCYDLCAKPEYFEPLRNEIDGLLKKEKKWNKNVLSNMWKMDSFLKESQRLSPASIRMSFCLQVSYLAHLTAVDFHRMVRAPLTLSNGVHLPAGTYLCAASDAIAKDPINTPDAHQFDGLRYYKKRQDPKEMHRHQFATTDKNHLHFGHGKYACPGRFFASDELKLILGHLIMKYDMSFLPGQSRPVNLNADEFMYPDPTARLRIKERHMASF